MDARAMLEKRTLMEEKLQTLDDERQERLRLVEEKWTPLLAGLPARTRAERAVRQSSAQLFENQMVNLTRDLSEDTRMINVGGFQKYIFPVLRRTVPNLIAHDLVSVQPLTAPIGAIFYMDTLYGDTKGTVTKGDIFPRDFNRDYSSEFISGEILFVGNGVLGGGAGAAVDVGLGYYPVRPLDTSLGFSVVIKELNSSGVAVQTATDNGAGGFTFSPAGGNTAGTINYSNGAISGFKFQNAPALNNNIRAYYFWNSELSSKIPQMQLDVKKAAVEVISRKLKAIWSLEAMEDLRALHGIEAEVELTANLSMAILLEIDREIIDYLFRASSESGISGVFDRVPPAGIAEIDHLRAILTTMSTVSNTIHQQTLRAPANWVVTSPFVSALLTQLTTHHDYRPVWVSGDPASNPMDMPRPLTQHGQFGIYKVGTLMNKWVLYEDPFFSRDFMLLGLKGGSYLDAGFVYAPYVPLQVTQAFVDPSDQGVRKGFRTRYAVKLTRANFYGQIRVLNL